MAVLGQAEGLLALMVVSDHADTALLGEEKGRLCLADPQFRCVGRNSRWRVCRPCGCVGPAEGLSALVVVSDHSDTTLLSTEKGRLCWADPRVVLVVSDRHPAECSVGVIGLTRPRHGRARGCVGPVAVSGQLRVCRPWWLCRTTLTPRSFQRRRAGCAP